MDNQELLIGQLASATGVSVRSLRHYEKRGLITSTRMSNGYRRFSPATINTVTRITMLLDAGFSLRAADIILPCFELDDEGSVRVGMCPDVAREVRASLRDISRQAKKLKARREAIIKLAESGVGESLD